VTSSDRSIHVSTVTGQVTTEDGHLQYASSDVAAGSDPLIAAIAFSDDHPFAAHTTLYGVDSMQGTLVRVGDVGGAPDPSSNGQVHTIGSLGIATDARVGFDITPQGGALLSATAPGASQSDLYTVDLATGAVQQLGTIVVGSPVRALTWRGTPAPRVFGITDQNTVVTFRPGTPTAISSSHAVTGLAAGETLVAIDQRPNDGLLYALSSASRLYTLNPATGATTALGPPFTVALAGTAFDLEFTPLFGAARVVGDGDQNLRVNPLDGSVVAVDQTLMYGAADPQFGLDPGIVAAAFDHNEFGASETTLYAIDATADSLVRIGSLGGLPDLPNGGMLTTIGPLGVAVGPRSGMDIDTNGVAFASLDLGSVTNLCTIDLATGAVRDIGTIGGSGRVIDIALEVPPAPTLYGVDDADQLVSFLAGTPREMLSTRLITGVPAGESIVALDFRPASGELLGTSDQARVYRIDRTTAVATPLGADSFVPVPAGTRLAADVDPKTDELRVVSDGDSNLRVSTTTGQTLDVDTNLAYAPGDVNFGNDPGVVSIAHTQSYVGASSTALFGIDATFDVLVRQGAFAGPSNGQLRTVGPLGFDMGSETGFDVDAHGMAFASKSGASNSSLYRVNLTTGALSPLGAIGGSSLRDIAILPR
jgi:hypothetical protein